MAWKSESPYYKTGTEPFEKHPETRQTGNLMPVNHCSNCGVRVEGKHIHCYSCGVKIERNRLLAQNQCLTCSTILKPEENYCFSCGVRKK